MLILNIILILIIIVMIICWPKAITITDELPKVDSPKNRWLQLQNEGAKYIKVKDGKVYLKIVK